MGWFLICAAIALLGGAYLFAHARVVWRKTRSLLDEVDQAATRAQEASVPGPRPDGPAAT